MIPAAKSQPVGRHLPEGMYSSIRQDWATPKTLFRFLNAEFDFTLDVCAQERTRVCEEFFAQDALNRPWVPLLEGSVWCNPPYGRAIGKWVEKGYRDSQKYLVTVVMLLPARTDTTWWHNYCMKSEVRFLQGRLNFDDTRRARAPFPSAIVVFRPPNYKRAL